jgi:osmotically inducible protein OsmC
MINRKADARWEGDLKGGKGQLKLGSGAFEGAYSFGTRFEGAQGTNPEELLGAAHAACFSMAFALGLSQAGHQPRHVATNATVHLDKVGGGFGITGITLDTRAAVDGISDADFQRIANETKEGCIISRALKSVPMTLNASRA